jgi:hypothetical protein
MTGLAQQAVMSSQVWPWNWPIAAQVALLTVGLPAIASWVAILVKDALDRRTLRTQHRLNVREKLLSTSYAYSCDYLMPLASSAGNLATHLIEFSGAESEADKQTCMDAIFYEIAFYIRLESALRSYIPLPEGPNPLGLFLASEKSENRVWDLIMPAWAFGIRTLEQRSVLVSKLYCNGRTAGDPNRNQLLAPGEYLTASRTASDPLSLVRASVENHIKSHAHLGEAMIVLYALSDLINYEVRLVLSAWYTDPQYPTAAIAQVSGIPIDIRKKVLGIEYQPLS